MVQTNIVMSGVLHCMHMWAKHHYVHEEYCSKLPVTRCRPFDVQPMLGWQGWSCPRVSYHAIERRCACFFSYDTSSWYDKIVLHTPGLSGRSSKQSSLGYSSTTVERCKRCSGYSGSSIFTSSTTRQYLNNKGVDRVVKQCCRAVVVVSCTTPLRLTTPHDVASRRPWQWPPVGIGKTYKQTRSTQKTNEDKAIIWFCVRSIAESRGTPINKQKGRSEEASWSPLKCLLWLVVTTAPTTLISAVPWIAPLPSRSFGNPDTPYVPLYRLVVTPVAWGAQRASFTHPYSAVVKLYIKRNPIYNLIGYS